MQAATTTPSRFRLRRFFQFSLLSFLVAVSLLAGAFGCARHRAEHQRLAVEWIESQGGQIRYDHYRQPRTDVFYSTGSEEAKAEFAALRPKNSWIANTLGEHYVHRIENIHFQESQLQGEAWRLAHARGAKLVSFWECEISAEVLEALGRCKSVEEISIVDCRCDTSGLAHLANLPKLKRLTMHRIKLDGDALAHLGKCVSLESLSLTYSTFPADEIENLRPLNKLTYCALGFTSVGDEQLSVVSSWPNLQRIDLSDHVTDAGLDHLTELKNLDSLAFLQSKVTDEGIVKLVKLPKLKSIQMSNCQLSDELMTRLSVNEPHWEISYVR
jgi:hypothetical protein